MPRRCTDATVATTIGVAPSNPCWRQRSRGRRSRAIRARGPVVAVAIATVVLASCSSPPAPPFKASSILSSNAVLRSVHLDLVAAATSAYGGFNFDGYGGGELRVEVPVGWTVDVTCTNASTAFSHSCAIIDDRPISPIPGAVAFPGAAIPEANSGLGIGSSSRFSFVASKVGTYRISCQVIGHEADGMWDWFVVTRGGVPRVVISTRTQSTVVPLAN
jgi:hypothetical protein